VNGGDDFGVVDALEVDRGDAEVGSAVCRSPRGLADDAGRQDFSESINQEWRETRPVAIGRLDLVAVCCWVSDQRDADAHDVRLPWLPESLAVVNWSRLPVGADPRRQTP
jgi:hypothetical protein